MLKRGFLFLVPIVVIAWLLFSSTKKTAAVSELSSDPIDTVTQIKPNKKIEQVDHYDTIDSKFDDLMVPDQPRLTSDYSYSIIDAYYANNEIKTYETKEYNGDPFVFYTFDTECVRDLTQRVGYLSVSANIFCHNIRDILHEWLPSIADACYNDIAWPLANDKNAYRMGTDGWGHILRENIENCNLYYPDAPLYKKFGGPGKRLGDVRHQKF